MMDCTNSTAGIYYRDPNLTTAYPPKTVPEFYTTTTYTAEIKPTEDEKVKLAKEKAEAKRVRKMKEMWKMDRASKNNRRGL